MKRLASFLELRVPPVAVVLLAAALMWLLAGAAPAWRIEVPMRLALSIVLAGAGIAVALEGIRAFRAARTTVNPLAPQNASAVVDSGIYRASRNPMYLGMLLVLAGWGAWLSNLAALAGLPAFAAYMTRFQIRPEERALQQKFGAPYAAYLRQVRRWL